MKPEQPNIIFILMDDLGWTDISCNGSSFYETPHTDRLAAEGLRFTDAYAACPVCSPTRASILTGRYPAKIGVTDWIDWAGWVHPARGKLIDAPYIHHLPLEEKSIASALKQGGYRTWHVGKWHLGDEEFHPDKQGFDVNIGGCKYGSPHQGYFSPWGLSTLPDAQEGTYLPDHLTDKAIDLIRNRGTGPFFLNLWYYLVHTPIQAPQTLVDKYTRKAAEKGLDQSAALEEGEFFPSDHKRLLRVTRRLFHSDPVYAAMVEAMDTNIGRILQTLDELGIADNTVVIFTSDNGGLATSEGSPTCNSPLHEGKGWMYEGGTREPLLVRWPRVIQPGRVTNVPVTSPDFYPTLLDIAALEQQPTQHEDGVSLLPLLQGADNLDRDAIYWHYPHYGNQGGTPGSSIRRGDNKLIEFFEDGRLELYNLKDDIGEQNNLVDAEPEIAAEMQSMLAKWRSDCEARIPRSIPTGRASIVSGKSSCARPDSHRRRSFSVWCWVRSWRKFCAATSHSATATGAHSGQVRFR